MSLFTFNRTHANVVAERDAALAKVKVIRKLADERKDELKKCQNTLVDMNQKYQCKVTDHQKEREAKEKANRSVESWKGRAVMFVNDVKTFANDITGEAENLNTTSSIKEFNHHMSTIEKAYNTMVDKYEYKVGEFHTEREAKEKVIGEFHTEREAKEKVKAALAKESEAKRSLEATLKLRDEEITRLRAEIVSVNTRFDALTSLATENIVSRFSGMVNGNNKRIRITDQVD